MDNMEDIDLNSLAGRLLELREEKRYIEGEIERVAGTLVEQLEPGSKQQLGDIQVRLGVARPGLRIVKAEDVPAHFCTQQPDRKRLLEHIEGTGEVPPGVAVSEGRPTVFTKALSAPREGDEGGVAST